MNARVKVWLFFMALGFIFLMNINQVFAEEECVIQKAQDILNCALAKHPDVVNAELEKDRDKKLVDIAKQRPNPELESSLLFGNTADDTNPNTQTSLMMVLELGGKRKARIEQASQSGKKSAINIQENKEIVALQTVLALYRLREINAELTRVNETIATFDKTLNTFKSRPKLTPEQEVSFSSFSLAREEYRLKKTSLIQEQSNLSYSLSLSTGVAFDTLKKFLPSFKSQWPSLSDNSSPGSSQLAKAKADLNLSGANIRVARSKAWPDLKIGPTFTTESLTTSNTTIVTGGVGFSLPLPILNRNQGEKAFAYADKQRAETNLALTLKKTAVERENQQQRYKSAVQALKQSGQISNLNLQHENIESYFEKGLVPSTLVIETHRQLYEITKTRNEQELAAIDALWRIYIIDGKVFEAKL